MIKFNKWLKFRKSIDIVESVDFTQSDDCEMNQELKKRKFLNQILIVNCESVSDNRQYADALWEIEIPYWEKERVPNRVERFW